MRPKDGCRPLCPLPQALIAGTVTDMTEMSPEAMKARELSRGGMPLEKTALETYVPPAMP